MAHDLHDLTPAYALDALADDERGEYERHLATCERCKTELAELRETSSMLAYAVESPAPPEALRQRILDQARLERGNVVPLRPRRALTYAWGAAAAVAAAVALAVGLWANDLSDDLDAERAVVAILADPDAREVAMGGDNGRVVVTESGDAALVVAGVPAAPPGKVYEVWVFEGARPLPAGLFEGGRRAEVVKLTRRVPTRARVAVTIERDGGADAPTSQPIMSAQT